MILTPEERYWLEANWRTTCRTVLQLAIPLSLDVVVETLEHGEPTEKTWRRFIDRAARELDKARANCRVSRGATARPPRSVMFAAAMSLLGDAEPMLQELRTGRPRLETGGVAVLWSCLRRGLLRMRYRMSGATENRSKTWRRLDVISRQVFTEQVKRGRARDGDQRCHREHYEAVAAYIREVYPSDRNLPRTFGSVADLFEAFSPECEVLGDYLEAVDETDIALLPDLSRRNAYLVDCIERLDGDLALACRFVRASGSPIELAIEAFCAQVGVAKAQARGLHERLKKRLHDCVQTKLAPRLMVVT